MVLLGPTSTSLITTMALLQPTSPLRIPTMAHLRLISPPRVTIMALLKQTNMSLSLPPTITRLGPTSMSSITTTVPKKLPMSVFSKEPTGAILKFPNSQQLHKMLAPWGLIPSQAMAFSNNFKHHRISHKSTPSWTCCQTLRTWFIQLASSTSWVQGFLPTVHLTIWTTKATNTLVAFQMFKIHLRQTFTWMLVWISWVFGRMFGSDIHTGASSMSQ
ncbi:hypothetical protein PSHT_01534, partial [Puccinia striiformis]